MGMIPSVEAQLNHALGTVDNLQKRIVMLEMALSEIADGRVEGFDSGEEGAVFFLQERARRALLNPFK